MSTSPSIYPILVNARQYLAERLESRPGQAIGYTLTGATLVHSVRRIMQGNGGTSNLLVGCDTNLFISSNPSASIASGFSGNPLTMTPIEPPESPNAWMYIADSAQMKKVSVDGTMVFGVGIAPPLAPPSIEFGAPAIGVIEDWHGGIGSWANGGTAGALAGASRYASNIIAILYDSGTTGWASVVPTTVTNGLEPGMAITTTQTGITTETDVIQSVLPNAIPSSPAVTIAAIAYDSGTSGPCSITLSIQPGGAGANAQSAAAGLAPLDTAASIVVGTSSTGIQPDTVLLLNGSEYIRVQAIAVGPNGQVSIRASTTATHAAGESVVGVVSFRVYYVGAFTSIGTLAAYLISSTIGTGAGWAQIVAGYNLGTVNGMSIQQDDIIHLSFSIDNPANLTELRVMFDVDPATNDFAHTVYYMSFRQADIQAALSDPAATSLQQARATSIVRNYVNTSTPASGPAGRPRGQGPIPASRPTGLGRMRHPVFATPTTQQVEPGGPTWSELRFRVSDLQLFGTAAGGVSLAGVKGIRLQVTTTASAVCEFSSLWIGGTYGPDTGDTGSPYLYRYLGRAYHTSGAMGNASPPTRAGLAAQRQQIIVTLPFHPDPQVDTLDVYRWGGTLLNWIYVGSVANPSSGTATFTDNFADLEIASNPKMSTDNFQPFPTIDTPKKGTVNVVGSTITWASGDHFNTAWAQGTQININGVFYTLYSQPSSTTAAQIVENAGTQTGAPFFITQATILGVPLPYFWGPYSQGTALVCFACGDKFQPGVIFLTNGNNPDSASDIYQFPITSPSDPLVNGCMYGNGNAYVWSANRMFSLYPTFGNNFVVNAGSVVPAEGTNLFVPLEVPNGKGLWAPWALAVGPQMWFLSRDGIYETVGGSPQSITVGPWATLFPHGGVAGENVTIGGETFYAPDMTQTAKLRLSYYDSHLYFDYQDTQGNQRTLVYNTDLKMWGVDEYTFPIIVHYGDEGQGTHALWLGGIAGTLYQASGSQDVTTPFAFTATMPQMSEQAGGFQHLGEKAYFGLLAPSSGITLGINADGVDYDVTIPAASAYVRDYVVVPAVKGRLWQFSLTGTAPFVLFERDCQIDMKPWGGQRFVPVNPFSALTRAATPRVK